MDFPSVVSDYAFRWLMCQYLSADSDPEGLQIGFNAPSVYRKFP